MTTQREREGAAWLEFRRQLSESGLTRREAARMGLLATASGVLIGADGEPAKAQLVTPQPVRQSPVTEGFLQNLVTPPTLAPVPLSAMTPAPNPAAHQYYGRYSPTQYYKLYTTTVDARVWHPQMAPDRNSWGYNGSTPGPTLDLTYGQPVLIRIQNQLPDPALHRGFGYPGSITHLHNFHSASESDGGPWRYALRGERTDHHFTLARAGFSYAPDALAGIRDVPAGFAAPPGGTWWAETEGGGDLRETLTTLFYHQHMPDFTAANTYKGLTGFCRVFDAMDCRDETRGWRLPWGQAGECDIPLVLADKAFDANGQLFFDPFLTDGFLGDKYTVNGKIKPYLNVKRRKYRFRILNAGPSRFYTVMFRNQTQNTNLPFAQISDNGNLLNRTRRNLTASELWVGERTDVIVDFSQCRAGDRVYLANVLVMRADGRGADRSAALRNPADPTNWMMEFRVSGDPVTDASVIPDTFRPYSPIVLSEVAGRKSFQLGRGNGSWQINGQVWDPDIDHGSRNPLNPVRRNTAEIWTLRSQQGGWEHPMHIHFEEGRLISKNGRAIPADQSNRLDIYRLGELETAEIFIRFRDFPDPNYAFVPPTPITRPTNRFNVDRGRYVMHCHNTVHEDHAMMTSFSVVP